MSVYQSQVPFTQECFVPSLVEIDSVEEHLQFLSMYFCFFVIISTFNLKKNSIPSPLKALCQVWLNWPSGSGEEADNVKVYRQTDGRTWTMDKSLFKKPT